MDNKKVAESLRAVHQLEVEQGLDKAPSLTRDCPSRTRVRAVTQNESEWTQEEQQHMAHCEYCRVYVPVFQQFVRQFPPPQVQKQVAPHEDHSPHKSFASRIASSLAVIGTALSRQLARSGDEAESEFAPLRTSRREINRERADLAGQVGGRFNTKFGAYSALAVSASRAQEGLRYEFLGQVEDEAIKSYGVESFYEVSASMPETGGGIFTFNFQPLEEISLQTLDANTVPSPSLAVTIYNLDVSIASAVMNRWGQIKLVLPPTVKTQEVWPNLHYVFSTPPTSKQDNDLRNIEQQGTTAE